MPVNGNLFQEQLIAHGATTLAHMKTGSLFRILKKDIPNCEECVWYFQRLCSPFGYQFTILKETKDDSLIYVYNETKVSHVLSKPSIQSFLEQYGYESTDVDSSILHLKERLQGATFPHEIGIFLGYPLQDVLAFITPQKECLLIGYWRVYGNAKNIQRTFNRYNCLTKTMEQKLAMGEPFVDILRKLN